MSPGNTAERERLHTKAREAFVQTLIDLGQTDYVVFLMSKNFEHDVTYKVSEEPREHETIPHTALLDASEQTLIVERFKTVTENPGAFITFKTISHYSRLRWGTYTPEQYLKDVPKAIRNALGEHSQKQEKLSLNRGRLS